MRLALILVATLLGGWAMAQDKGPEKKAEAKVDKRKAAGRKKPTPEQIRKFNDLEKKQAK